MVLISLLARITHVFLVRRQVGELEDQLDTPEPVQPFSYVEPGMLYPTTLKG